ncbi:MAG: hypothetical protein HYT09_03555 [Candidatus Levybacteria bacterium]|nr:hypothetical protein [Candidatus Levybacteria bacterium]
MNHELRIMDLLATSALLILSFFAASNATAQEIRTYTIVPPTVEVNLDPGGYSEGFMKVINDSDEPLSFTVVTQDFIVEDSKGTPSLLPENSLSDRYSAASWIGVIPSTFTIEPREQQMLNYYIQIPLSARPGGHYSAVVYKPTNPIELGGSGAAVQTNLGTLFYVGVKGDIKENAGVINFRAKRFSEYGPIKLFTTITNLGDLHIKPTGTITVKNMLGREVAKEKFNEANIFPGATRDFENKLGGKFMIGRYKASLLASYGVNKNLPLSSDFYFWVFPWKIAIVVTLVIIAIILGIIYWKRKNIGKYGTLTIRDR